MPARQRGGPLPAHRHRTVVTATTVLLWALAAGLTVYLVCRRYETASSGAVGSDFRIFLRAARNIAAGRSPYAGDRSYVYPPPLAMLLVPLIHLQSAQLWRVWTSLVTGASVVAAGAFVASQRARLAPWLWPILFAFCAFTSLYIHYWPLSRDLWLGQSDTLAFAAIMLSASAATRGRPGRRGMWVGVAGLVKLWPAAIGVALFQRDSGRRRPAMVALSAVLVVGPALALLLGGGPGLAAFLRDDLAAGKQHLVNDSVWGAPGLLFSRSGMARPLYVSTELRLLASMILAAWVLGLLVVILRTAGDPALCTWNVTFCVILLLPVSHRQYAIYALPLLWSWAAYLAGPARINAVAVAAFLVMTCWWLLQTEAWPYRGSSAAISSVRYCVPFAADMVACTTSVMAAAKITGTRKDPPPPGEGQGCARSSAAAASPGLATV